ncbi:MAG TPA: helix-turn-helix domain-containing protein [Solirubrobacterales bacterium]|nr:helix-turn-helix domain-containing protein [Solirubrobacterales bacterium]
MAGSKRGRKRRRNKNHGLLVALRHPVRRKILRRMSDERKASPSELSKAIDQPLSSVAYHVRVLVTCGALKPVSERELKGSTQHFYRWSVTAEWVRPLLEEDDDE